MKKRFFEVILLLSSFTLLAWRRPKEGVQINNPISFDEVKNWIVNHQNILVIIGVLLLFVIILIRAAEIMDKRKPPLPKGSRYCPKCGEEILKIDLECFNCRKKLR